MDVDYVQTFALVSVYGPPDQQMLDDSFHTLWACHYLGSANLKIIKLKEIISVVSMQPFHQDEGDPDNLWFVVEKSGLDDVEMIVAENAPSDGDSDHSDHDSNHY
jgi:hypothetical protein